MVTVNNDDQGLVSQIMVNGIKSVDMVNVQMEIQNIFITALRDIFRDDPSYTFLDNDILTNILINAPYASDLTEYKVPEVIVSDPTFGIGPNGMMNSFLDEIRSIDGVLIGYKYVNVVEFNVAIQCLSSVESEAKMLSNLIRNYVHQAYNGLFFKKGILIMNTQNPGGAPKEQSPEKRWSFEVGVRGTTKLITTQWAGNEDGLLEKINITDYLASKKK